MLSSVDSYGSQTVPLLAGDAGIKQTIDLIRKLVDQGVKDPLVNRYAIELLRAAPPYDRYSEAKTIYDYVLANFRFVPDPLGPFGPKETLRRARDILHLRAGDCDDINGVLLPSLFGTVGFPTRVVTIASDPTSPEDFSHIYAEVCVNGDWIPADAARPDTEFGLAPPVWFRKRTWSLTDSSYEDSSPKQHGLSGYVVLGQDEQSQDQFAVDVSAITSGAAEVIAAARRQPFDPFAYPPPVNPYVSFQTPYSPGGVAYTPGYPTGPAVSGTIAASGASPNLLVGAVLVIGGILLIRSLR